jgi:hypothetical protein
MLFIIRNWTGFAGATVIGIGAFAGIYFIWYRNLPKTNLYDSAPDGAESKNHNPRP